MDCSSKTSGHTLPESDRFFDSAFVCQALLSEQIRLVFSIVALHTPSGVDVLEAAMLQV